VDIDAESIAYARRTYVRPGLEYFSADALEWSPADGRPFNTIVSFETIEHLAAPTAFVARLAHHLEPRGILLISAPNALQFSRAPVPIRNPYHLSEPDHATLCAWLAPHFDILSEWEQSTIGPDEGAHAALDVRVRNLERHGGMRLWGVFERALRQLVGRPLPAIGAAGACPSRLVSFTDIWPLLPERRDHADVFLFVCRKRV
jgi:SAM-dependent methyltransferase